MGAGVNHSPSSIKLYQTCPRKFYREKVLRDVVPEMGEAARKGIERHQHFEDCLKADRADLLPGRYPAYVGLLDRTFPARRVEHRMALDADLKPCHWDKGWIRGIADALWWDGATGTALVVDWKTGSRRPWHLQLRFYAYYVFAASEQVKQVRVMFEWLKEFTRDAEEFSRSDMPALATEIVAAAERIEADTTWAPRPGGLCKRFCQVPDCEFR